MAKQKFDFASAIKELEEINHWFQSDEIDLDVGLEKLKQGKDLINQCRSRLQQVENEFTKIKADYKSEPESTAYSKVAASPVINDANSEDDSLI